MSKERDAKDDSRSEELIAEARKWISHFKEREDRALERLGQECKENRSYFAILGISSSIQEVFFEPFLTVRPVPEPPGEIELAEALRNKSLMSSVGRYTQGISHELIIDGLGEFSPQQRLRFAWWFISTLRIRTLVDFLVPAVSDRSWSTIAAIKDGTCDIRLLEDVPKSRRFTTTANISKTDLKWCADNWMELARLLQSPRIHLAVECLTTHHHEASLRMSTASLWAGIESIFGIDKELRFRLAALTASFLEPRGDQRITRYKAVKKLYDFRSRVVHGAAARDTELVEHIREVRLLLSSLLCRMIESRHAPFGDEWDSVLLG